MTTLSLRRVSKSFGRTRVLHDLSLDVAPGEVVALLGPNGAGKTTTLRLIAGLIRPDEGEILIGGKSLLRNRQLCQRSVGYLPDTPFVYPNLTGREMLLLVSDLRRLPRSESLPRIEQLLAQFDLTEDVDRLTGEYSLGMKRKLGLCMALLHRPSLLLLDEPLNGLDPGQAPRGLRVRPHPAGLRAHRAGGAHPPGGDPRVAPAGRPRHRAREPPPGADGPGGVARPYLDSGRVLRHHL